MRKKILNILFILSQIFLMIYFKNATTGNVFLYCYHIFTIVCCLKLLQISDLELCAKINASVSRSALAGCLYGVIFAFFVCFKVQRFGELMRRLDGITQSTLTKQLRELESDGFLHREIYKEIPPKVEYTLTELGESFIPVLHSMMAWSEAYLCMDYENPYQISP